MPPGAIETVDGRIVGTHRGLMHYTVGQRRGLGVSGLRPYYVVRLDPERNAVIVGHDEETFAGSFRTGPVCWGGMPRQEEPFTCLVQLRSRHLAVPATIKPDLRGATVEFDTPEQAVTPGQWAVFYDAGGYVLGSAIVQQVQFAPPAMIAPLGEHAAAIQK